MLAGFSPFMAPVLARAAGPRCGRAPWLWRDGVCAAFTRVSGRQREPRAWASVQRKARVRFVIAASALWKHRDFCYGECAGEGAGV